MDKDLFCAVVSHHVPLVVGLLKAGLDVHDRDTRGWTPLHPAADVHAVDVARVLLDHGADVHAQDIWWNTPLMRAVYRSDRGVELIKLLVARGADPDMRNNSGLSPRDLAFRDGIML